MKLETYILRGLFVACVAVCGLICVAMVNSKPEPMQFAGNNAVSTVLASAPTRCALPLDGLVCVGQPMDRART